MLNEKPTYRRKYLQEKKKKKGQGAKMIELTKEKERSKRSVKTSILMINKKQKEKIIRDKKFQ